MTFTLRMAAALTLAACVLSAGCGGGNDAGDSSAMPASFESWDGFMASAARTSVRPRPVVFVGIDGGTWDYMDQLTARGLLPNVARIQETGTRATLRSVQSYVSPPAWTTMLTGYLPEKSGVYSFGVYDREKRTFGGIRSGDAMVPFVWEAAGRAGLKTAVINVPMTYPVYPVKGIMVSGLLTPIDLAASPVLRLSQGPDLKDLFERARRDASSRVKDTAEPMMTATEDDLNLMLLLLHDTVDDGRRRNDTVSAHVYRRGADGNPEGEPFVATFPSDRYSPWLPLLRRDDGEARACFARVRLDLDGADAGVTWSESVYPIDATYTYPESLAAELKRRFGFYLPTKMVSGPVVPAVTRDTAEYGSFFYDYDDWDFFCFVFTQSDNVHHKSGFAAEAESVYVEIDRFLGEMMERMPADAVLVVGSDHGFSTFETGIDLNSLFEQMGLLVRDDGNIDQESTLVFHNLWYLYFNHDLVTHDELTRRGFDVPPAADPVEFLRGVVTEACANLAVRGRYFPIAVEPMPAVVAGDAPDMRVTGTYDGYMVEYWALQHPRSKIVYSIGGHDRHWHSRDGILLLWGDGVRPGYDAGVIDIEDVAPTISYFLGIPVSADMDGSLPTRAFDDALITERPVLVTDHYRDIPRIALDENVDREELEKKLRSLGYIQ